MLLTSISKANMQDPLTVLIERLLYLWNRRSLLKTYIFYAIRFLYVFQEKSWNKPLMGTQAYYFCLTHFSLRWIINKSSIPMGAINFYGQKRFLHLLTPLLLPCLQCIYMQECSEHSLVRFLFPWVQFLNVKPVLSHCSQTGFATVDDFIALYTRSYIFYSHGCNKFLHARRFWWHEFIPW